MSLCDKCVADCNCGVKPGELVVTCGAFKAPPTNADRIRAMGDEELAELLCSADWCEHCDYLRGDGTCEVMENMLGDDGPLHPYCVAACLNYLRQPAEEVQSDE